MAHRTPPSRPPNGPTRLAQWQHRLLEVQLPVRHPAVCTEALNVPDLSGHDLLQCLQTDVALGTVVVTAAARHPRLRETLRGLPHAVNMLGVEQTCHLARDACGHTFDPKSPGHVLSRRAMATSVLATHLVRRWATPDKHLDVDYLVWVTLLLGLSRWKLPLASPELAAQIEQRVAHGEHRAAVEQAVLGCSADDLNTAHLKDLGLADDAELLRSVHADPRLLVQASRLAWTGHLAPQVPAEVGRWLHQPTTACSLAHILASAAQDDWHSRRTRTLMAAVSAHLGRPLEPVVRDIYQAAVSASHDVHFDSWVQAPAARMFHESPKPRWLGHGPRPPHGVPQRPAVAAPNHDAVQLFTDNCKLGRHADMASFLAAASHTLVHGLGLARSALFIKRTGADAMACYTAHGFDPQVMNRHTTLSTVEDNLLSRLFHQPTVSIWIKEAHVASARKLLPPAMADSLCRHGLFLSSIHVNRQSVGVIWADIGSDEWPLTQAHYSEFRLFASHFGMELSRLARSRAVAAH